MDLNTAIDVIESVAGFTDANTSVGEAWAVVMAQLKAAPVPVAVSERPWEREGWCDSEGRCWCMSSLDGPPPRWWLVRPEPLSDGWVLPAQALSLPNMEVK